MDKIRQEKAAKEVKIFSGCFVFASLVTVAILLSNRSIFKFDITMFLFFSTSVGMITYVLLWIFRWMFRMMREK